MADFRHLPISHPSHQPAKTAKPENRLPLSVIWIKRQVAEIGHLPISRLQGVTPVRAQQLWLEVEKEQAKKRMQNAPNQASHSGEKRQSERLGNARDLAAERAGLGHGSTAEKALKALKAADAAEATGDASKPHVPSNPRRDLILRFLESGIYPVVTPPHRWR